MEEQQRVHERRNNYVLLNEAEEEIKSKHLRSHAEKHVQANETICCIYSIESFLCAKVGSADVAPA